jgi:16S rRNA (cytidine1402-2'-O)-methyltransferase
LSISCGLTLEQGWSRTDTVAGWKSAAMAVPNDRPAVFGLLG